MAGTVTRLWPKYSSPILRRAIPRLIVALSLGSALISGFFLVLPWNVVAIVLNVAIALLALSDLKTRDQLTAEHHYMMSQTPEGELANVFANHNAETRLDALVQAHFKEIPGTSGLACRHCDWRTDDFADRLRIAPAHLRRAHTEIDPRVPRFLSLRATKWIGRRMK